MKSHYYLTAIATVAMAGAPRLASAQLISTNRCANAPTVTQPQAAGRYAWANFCRLHPRMDATGVVPMPASAYLTQASIAYSNHNTNAAEKANLFPTYFNVVTGGSWDIPDNAYTITAPLPPPPGCQPPLETSLLCEPTGGAATDAAIICPLAQSQLLQPVTQSTSTASRCRPARSTSACASPAATPTTPSSALPTARWASRPPPRPASSTS